MKKTSLLISAALLCTLSLSAQQANQKTDVKDNTLTPEEFAEGWELMFDGSTLNGWKAYNGNAFKAWSINDNALHCEPAKGGEDIFSIDCFGDFDLKFDWKIEKSGNSGVIYMSREGQQWSRPYQTGPEFQVFDDAASFDKNSVGSLYDVYPPYKNRKLNPAMEWNSGRIRLSKGVITHWVNGEIVMQCKLYSDDWNTRVAKSKWKDDPYFGKSPFGHIDFQNHGSKVWYKNIKIHRL